jgi:flagellar basal body-associated protein FliL
VIAKKIVEQLFMPVMEIAFAAILIGVGVTMFVLYRVNDAEFKQVIMIILGSILILVAIAMAVVTTIGVHKRAKKRREQERQEVVRRNEEVHFEEAAPATVEVVSQAKDKKEEPEIYDAPNEENVAALENKTVRIEHKKEDK